MITRMPQQRRRTRTHSKQFRCVHLILLRTLASDHGLANIYHEKKKHRQLSVDSCTGIVVATNKTRGEGGFAILPFFPPTRNRRPSLMPVPEILPIKSLGTDEIHQCGRVRNKAGVLALHMQTGKTERPLLLRYCM